MQFFTTLVSVLLAGAVAAAPAANAEQKRDCTCTAADYHTKYYNCMLPYWGQSDENSYEVSCANTVAADCGYCGVLYWKN
ncbi:hypothetical protein EG329_004114 [Mollisiaceae sp. DMI_Dod_QoI]|nr:hypothetical protein EG329_004114 [Helotiales sp. DMI_Dod_QoI]